MRFMLLMSFICFSVGVSCWTITPALTTTSPRGTPGRFSCSRRCWTVKRRCQGEAVVPWWRRRCSREVVDLWGRSAQRCLSRTRTIYLQRLRWSPSTPGSTPPPPATPSTEVKTRTRTLFQPRWFPRCRWPRRPRGWCPRGIRDPSVFLSRRTTSGSTAVVEVPCGKSYHHPHHIYPVQQTAYWAWGRSYPHHRALNCWRA